MSIMSWGMKGMNYIPPISIYKENENLKNYYDMLNENFI